MPFLKRFGLNCQRPRKNELVDGFGGDIDPQNSPTWDAVLEVSEKFKSEDLTFEELKESIYNIYKGEKN